MLGRKDMARKKNFDPDKVLKLAVDVFWERGYSNTSMTDLVTHLGINKFSIYSTFGDKKNLYVMALTYYINNNTLPALQRLTASDSGISDVEEFLKNFVELQYEQVNGCFVQNAILELSLIDTQVSEEGRRLYSLIIDAFVYALQNAQSKGEISHSEDVENISHFLLLQLQGIRVLGKAKQYKVMENAALIIIGYLAKLRC